MDPNCLMFRCNVFGDEIGGDVCVCMKMCNRNVRMQSIMTIMIQCRVTIFYDSNE